MATIIIGNALSEEAGNRRIAALNRLYSFNGHFLKPTFGLAPAGGSFSIIAETTYPHLDSLATDCNQTPDEYFRDTILHCLVNSL